MKPGIDWKGKKFSFFQNTKCEYFPCHNIDADADSFNCLFCFCPLYMLKDCGGMFTYLSNGCKDCSYCILPHKKESYGSIMERLENSTIMGEDAKNV